MGEQREVDTPRGPARIDLDAGSLDEREGAPAGLLVLGHGAGGGVDAPDLLALRDAALAAGMVVARVIQPYRVAGRRAPAFPLHPPARPQRSRLDELDTGVPTLVVNGDRDPFGVPPAAPGRRVEVRRGERHDLRRDPVAVAGVVVDWLRTQGWAR